MFETVGSHISEYFDPTSSTSALVGDSWALGLLYHLREVAVGLFDKVDDFSNKLSIGNYRQVHETSILLN